MKLMKYILNKEKVSRRKRLQGGLNDYRSQLGREQFKILVDRGLNVPVAYL